MTKLYLIRHAEAEGNLYRIAQGQYNSIITDRGWRQIRALERRFQDIHVDAVYASDLYRTCATASAIYRPKGLELHRRRDLREICVGVWEQKTWGEIARTDPVQMENFSHHLDRWHVEGAETPEQVRDRVLAAVRQIAAENDGKTVAVFSHGCAIRILLATLQGYSIAQLGQTPHGDNTAVSLIEADGAQMRVVFRDDNSHLTDPRYAQGETVKKRANALEPGLYFQPLRLPEDAALVENCAEAFPEANVRERAEAGTVLTGFLDQEAVGLVGFCPEHQAAENAGWISLFYIREPYRRRGYGVQLLGQAVAHYRPLGRRCLRIALTPEENAQCPFFRDYGFVPAGRGEDGREILEKDISFDPAFLGPEGESGC